MTVVMFIKTPRKIKCRWKNLGYNCKADMRHLLAKQANQTPTLSLLKSVKWNKKLFLCVAASCFLSGNPSFGLASRKARTDVLWW